MSKKLTLSVILFIITNLIIAQTTNRGLVLETITDPETTLGQPEIKFQTGHAGDVKSVSFSPDGKYIASVSNDKTLKLWDVESGKEVRTFSGLTYFVSSVTFSPDGKYVASASDDTVKLWEVESGKEICILSGEYFVSFSPDGKYIVSGNWDDIVLWEVESGKEIRTFTGHTYDVNSVSFSPDGKYIASGSDDGLSPKNYTT